MPVPLQTASGWPLRPGDTLTPGRRVTRRLGGGGAHEVFLVEGGGPLGRAVAKLPRPQLAHDLRWLRSLQDEGRALERLAHPAVPRHFATVLSGPHPHLLLEYVPGPTLSTALRARRTLPPVLVAELGCALARVLDHVGRTGWVHLDVKPPNIVLNAAPRLLDFELARPAADAAYLRRPSGTWQYMAPEQRAAGSDGAPPVGPPTDVYALALSLGEALAGAPLATLLRQEPATPPGPVGAVLAEALAPAPGDRPTAAELAAALAAFTEPAAPLAAAA
jgi:eukaryotic-like serine/threonine-protein kinase